MTIKKNLLRLLLAVLLASLPPVSAGAGEKDVLSVELSPLDGIQRIFPRPVFTSAPERLEPVPLRLIIARTDRQARTAQVHFTARDCFDRPLSWAPDLTVALPEGGAGIEVPVSYPAAAGYHRLRATVKSGPDEATGLTEFGVVPVRHPGLRPHSFFVCDSGVIRADNDLQLMQAIGLKVVKAQIQPEVITTDREWALKPATGTPLPLDFAPLDQGLAAMRQKELWLLPVAGCAFTGSGGRATAAIAEHYGADGPPRDFAEFNATWQTILNRYPELKLYEFWKNPEVFGPTWATNPDEFRRFLNQWCRMALAVNPDLQILTGGTVQFIREHVEPFPYTWKNRIHGITHQPVLADTRESHFRSGCFQRSLDEGLLATRRMGLPHYALTGTGAGAALPENPGKSLPQEVAAVTDEAARLVQALVRAALAGVDMCPIAWNTDCGPELTCRNTAIGVLTYLLEDRPAVAEIWPEHELLWGAIFASPGMINGAVRLLPRADELAVRWRLPVPETRRDDKTVVAVVWSLTGKSNEALDQGGTLTLKESGDCRAFDLSGVEIKSVAGQLTVPFNRHPVYLMSNRLSVADLRQRIAGAELKNLTPLTLYVQSLTRPATQAQNIVVRMENQLNRDLTGRLKVDISNGKSRETRFRIPAAKLADIALAWPGMAPNPDNLYGVTVTAETDHDGVVVRQQLLEVALFVKRTIMVDGNLNDWNDVVPVLLDSDFPTTPTALEQYLRNPQLDKPLDAGEHQRIIARLYTAYDDANIYLAAAVKEDALSCRAGTPATAGKEGAKSTLPYAAGVPDGFEHIVFCGDVLQFSFGFRDRLPNRGRQMQDPYAWKGHFFDTDYSFVAHVSAQGDRLLRLWSAHNTRQDAYQLENLPDAGQLLGGKIKISRNETHKTTIYELAIPRSAITLFNPGSGRFRFSFILNNNENLGRNGLSWSEAAGVFDHWSGGGSFPPSRVPRLPCQTFFGIIQ